MRKYAKRRLLNRSSYTPSIFIERPDKKVGDPVNKKTELDPHRTYPGAIHVGFTFYITYILTVTN